MINSQTLPSFTVAVPTYYGGSGLVRTIESIRASEGVDRFRIIVCVDANPLTPDIEQALKSLEVEIVFSPVRGGQVARIKQMLAMTDSEIIVLTQDDVIFTSRALFQMVSSFARDAELTMAASHVKPVAAETFFERIIERGVSINWRLGRLWRGSDNYLLASGRCLAFRTKWLKLLQIPEAVINSDAFFYFENRFRGGKFSSLSEAVVFNKSPQKLSEHTKQNKKFEYSKQELGRYFKQDLKSEYTYPKSLAARAVAGEWLRHPILTSAYLAVFAYTVVKKNTFVNAKPFWETDVTTKR